VWLNDRVSVVVSTRPRWADPARASGPRTLALALALALAPVGARGPAAVRAQAAPQPSAQTLVTGVAPSEVSPTETHVVLTFNRATPKFSILTNDSDVSIIAFTDARLAPGGAAPPGRHGLVQALSFTQNDGLLTLSLTGAGPVHVVAASLGAQAMILTVKAARSVAAKVEAAPGPVAAHADSGVADEVFEVVPLKYADVSEVVGLLTAVQGVKPNDTFNPQEPAFGSAGINSAGGAAAPNFNLAAANGAAADSLGQLADDTVGVDRRLNAIILKGPAARVARLKEQIVKLDVAVSSVVLETVFVELTESGARNLGLNFNNANNQIATVAYELGKGSFPSVTNTARNGAVTASLQVAIAAQIANGQGRIISRPRIAAQSGSTAKIITGDALPILTSIALSGVNAVQQQVQYVNVGVTLQIAPRVSYDGFVTSHVFAEVSSVTGFSQGYPTISQREASTQATVKDGESFIIGGLTQESDLRGYNRIPGLGSLPGLGKLFRAEASTRSKTDLYIIITPHIVRGPDEAAAALARNR